MIANLQLDRPYTAADLASMPEDGRKYEVIGGELIVSPSPSERHQRVSIRLAQRIQAHVERADIGVAYVAPFDVLLGEYDIVQPDLLVVLKENASRISDTGLVGPPDLAIEIVSPSSARSDLIRKRATYATCALPEYWIVDPQQETILAQRLVDGRYEPMTTDDGLVHSSRIVGLVIDTREIFSVPEWLASRSDTSQQ